MTQIRSEAPQRRASLGWPLVGAAALFGLFLVGYLPRHHQRATLRAMAAEGEGPRRVRVIKPRRSTAGAVKLPGSVLALREAAIYPRTSGYVRRWLVDMGQRVTAGQLLCEIDTPEVDQQLLQAQAQSLEADANLEQAKASVELARVSADRVVDLAQTKLAAPQDVDQRKADLRVAVARVRAMEAVLRSQQANVRRFVETKGFSRVVAPFAGTVTARQAEIGALVGAAGAGPPLFRLAQVDPVRVFINVPQALTPSIKEGQAARLLLREHPQRQFTGQVAHIAGSLDAATRTMLVEVQAPNHDGAILPGMYVQVELSGGSSTGLRLDATALLTAVDEPMVAVVDDADHVHLRKVTVTEDYGAEVAVSAGVAEGERVVLNPGDRLTEGQQVAVVPAG